MSCCTYAIITLDKIPRNWVVESRVETFCPLMYIAKISKISHDLYIQNVRRTLNFIKRDNISELVFICNLAKDSSWQLSGNWNARRWIRGSLGDAGGPFIKILQKSLLRFLGSRTMKSSGSTTSVRAPKTQPHCFVLLACSPPLPKTSLIFSLLRLSVLVSLSSISSVDEFS